MNIKSLFVALVFSLGAGAALADDQYADAGVLPIAPAAPYAHIFTHDIGDFTDTIDFVVPTGSLGASANPLNLSLGGSPVFNIVGLSFELWGGSSPSDLVSYGVFSGDDTSYDITLAAGSYHIYLTGSATGSGGGAYGVSLVSGVPEPETYAMMLFGLVLLGSVARFKKL